MQQYLSLGILLLSIISFYDGDAELRRVKQFNADCFYPRECFANANPRNYTFCANSYDGSRLHGYDKDGTLQFDKIDLDANKHKDGKRGKMLNGLLFSLIA